MAQISFYSLDRFLLHILHVIVMKLLSTQSLLLQRHRNPLREVRARLPDEICQDRRDHAKGDTGEIRHAERVAVAPFGGAGSRGDYVGGNAFQCGGHPRGEGGDQSRDFGSGVAEGTDDGGADVRRNAGGGAVVEDGVEDGVADSAADEAEGADPSVGETNISLFDEDGSGDVAVWERGSAG